MRSGPHTKPILQAQTTKYATIIIGPRQRSLKLFTQNGAS